MRSIAQADGLRSRARHALLLVFLQRPGTFSPVSDLLQAVWREETATSSNVVEVYVRYLRQKLEAEDQSRLLHTVRGRGYCLGAERAGLEPMDAAPHSSCRSQPAGV